jgi:hypothetical protein
MNTIKGKTRMIRLSEKGDEQDNKPTASRAVHANIAQIIVVCVSSDTIPFYRRLHAFGFYSPLNDCAYIQSSKQAASPSTEKKACPSS